MQKSKTIKVSVAVENFSGAQPRDSHGRWSSGGGGGAMSPDTGGGFGGAGGDVIALSSLKDKLKLDEYGRPSGVVPLGPLQTKVFRVGGLDPTHRGGVFFSGDRKGAEAYTKVHEDDEYGDQETTVKEYTVSLKNAVLVGHQNDLTKAWFGKTYSEMMNSYIYKYGGKDAASASSKFDKKLLGEAKRRGYDGIVYGNPAPPADTELAIIGDPKKKIN